MQMRLPLLQVPNHRIKIGLTHGFCQNNICPASKYMPIIRVNCADWHNRKKHHRHRLYSTIQTSIIFIMFITFFKNTSLFNIGTAAMYLTATCRTQLSTTLNIIFSFFNWHRNGDFCFCSTKYTLLVYYFLPLIEDAL